MTHMCFARHQRQRANTLIMAKSVTMENIETGKQAKSCRYFRAKVLDSHLSEKINNAVQPAIDNESIVFTDKCSACVRILQTL